METEYDADPDAAGRRAWRTHALSYFPPPDKPDILSWSERHVVYPHSDRCPRFSRDFAYWLNEPLQSITSGAWRVVSMMAPTGCGKTTMLETLACYAVTIEKGNILIAHQTDADSMTFGETRLLPMLEAIPACRERLPHNRHKVRKAEILFSDMGLYLGGANMSSLQSKSCRYVVLDEAWLLKGSMLREAMGRTHDRAASVVLVVGQGGVVNDEHDRLHQTTQQHTFGWLCPECASWHPYSFRGDLRYDNTRDERNIWNWRELAASVRMVCKKCGTEFADTEANRRLLSRSGSYRPIPCNGLPDRVGYTFACLAVWWIPWSTTVIEFVQANERKKVGDYTPLRQWIQKRCAEPWSEENEAPEVVFTASGYTMAEYEDGHPIDGEVMRFLSVDRQRDHFWAVLRAWRADGSSMMLFCGRLLEWSQVPALATKYKLGMPGRVMLDCGFDPSAIYAFAAEHGYVCFRGEERASEYVHHRGRSEARKFYSECEKVLVGNKRVPKFRWSNGPVKDILARLRGTPSFEIPADCPPEYQQHMTAEIKRDILNKVTGQVTRRWVKIGDRANHLWDMEALQVVGALMCGFLRLGEQAQAGGDEASEAATTSQ
jgi:hypothetical protein